MTSKLSVAYHNLATMLEAGMPIRKSLTTVVSGSRGDLKKGFSALAEAISAGDSLAETMAKHPHVFAPLDVMLVETADVSGNLPESFRLLSQWYEFRNRLKHILISGFMLPVVLFHIAVLIAPLPGLFLGSTTLAEYVFFELKTFAFVYVSLGVFYALWRAIPPESSVRWLLDAFTLRIPVLGQAVRQLSLSRYCRAFNMLYQAGVPITQCAHRAYGATGNAVIADLLKGGGQSAQAGGLVCEGFSRRLPAEFLQLWQIGEETGELDKTVGRLAVSTGETGEHLFVEFCRWLPRVLYFLILLFMALLILKRYRMMISAWGV